MGDTDTRFIAGCMTGTSMDGIDVSLVAVRGRGLAMTAHYLDHVSQPLGELSERMRRLSQPIDYLRAARRLGEIHADAVERLIAQTGVRDVDFVCAHGQTIWHAPQEQLSWQLFDPWPIVRRLRLPVVYDLRQADLIAGGQGAPITPLSDWIMYRVPERSRVIVNLGGVCNVTELPAGGTIGAVRGYDLCPCNLLIDGVVRRVYPNHAFDPDGQFASRGKASDALHARMRQAPFFARPLPRTTGREDFSESWLDELAGTCGLRGDDLIASAVEAVAIEIAGCAAGAEVILAGGGALNRELVRRIGLRSAVRLSDDVGVPVAAREAMAFAVLGALSEDGVPISLPQVTGADNPGVAGCWVWPST